MKAAGYLRVSTREQGVSGLGLEAQKIAIVADAARRGWELTVVSDVASGSDLGRPQLQPLLRDLDAGRYGALIVSRLDRLTRSLADCAALMDRAHKHGWVIVVLDSGLDMTTPWGRAMAGVAAAFAQLERDLISQRTKDGLAVARARGTFRPGEHSRYANRLVINRMVTMSRDAHMSDAAIADTLNLEDVPPPAGDRWHRRTVGRILARELEADRQAPAAGARSITGRR